MRRVSISTAAAQAGLTYEKKAAPDVAELVRALPGAGRGATLRHVMTGDVRGRAVLMLESTIVMSAGPAVVPISHVLLASPAPGWPAMSVTPRTFIARLLGVGAARRQFRLDDPLFAQRFSVAADDLAFAHALLGPEVRSIIFEPPHAAWRVGSGHLVVAIPGPVRAPAIAPALVRMERFWAHVPADLAP
jgi:hypothetical protein